jgi:lipopolysaccharide export system permease protein
VSTLTRLIVKEWLVAFFGSCMIFVMLVSVANVVSEVLRAVTTIQDILLNNLLGLPMWLNKIFPIAAMTASLFSLNKLQRRNELIAIFACGYSRASFFMVLISLSLVVATVQFFTAAYLRPIAEKQKKEWLRDGGIHFRKHEKTQTIKATTSTSGKIWYRNNSYYCSFSAFDKEKNELRDVSFFYYGQDYKLTQVIWAPKVTHQEGFNWLLPEGESLTSLQDKNFQTHKPIHNQPINLLERPYDFKDIDSEISELTLPHLYTYRLKIKRHGINSAEYETILYDRLASSLICLIFPFIAIGALFNPNRRQSSFGKNVAFVFVFTAIFWLTYSSFLAMASGHKIPPLIAVAIIPVGCMMYLLFTFYRRRRLS